MPCRIPVRRDFAEQRHNGPSFISPASLCHKSACIRCGCRIFRVNSSIGQSSSMLKSSSDDDSDEEHFSAKLKATQKLLYAKQPYDKLKTVGIITFVTAHSLAYLFRLCRNCWFISSRLFAAFNQFLVKQCT